MSIKYAIDRLLTPDQLDLTTNIMAQHHNYDAIVSEYTVHLIEGLSSYNIADKYGNIYFLYNIEDKKVDRILKIFTDIDSFQREVNGYNKLENYAPKLYGYGDVISYNYTDGLPRVEKYLIVEKYDGDLYDLLEQINQDSSLDIAGKNEYKRRIMKTIKDMILEVNRAGYRHGDFHRGNIVYKRNTDGTIKLAFIDFELLIEYDRHGRVISAKDYDNTSDNFTDYNQYYDLMNLETNLVSAGIKFTIPEIDRQFFWARQGPAEIEDYEYAIREDSPAGILVID